MSSTTKTLGHKEDKRKLPDGWRWTRLRELIREAQAGFACGQRDADGIAQLRMNNVGTRGNFVWDNVIRVPKEGGNIERFLLMPGDVLFNNTNSTELVGKSGLFVSYTEPIVYSNHFTRLRTDDSALLPDMLASWLNHQWQQGVFAAICNKWIGQSAVKADKLLDLEIPLPPLDEQKRIVAILNEQMAAVEKARAAAQARLEASRQLPLAILRAVFTSKLACSWPTYSIGDVAVTCSGLTPSRTQKAYFDGHVAWVKTGELRDNTIHDTEEHLTDLAVSELGMTLLPPGTLLIAMYGQGQTRGRTGLLAIPAATNQACFAILPNDSIDTRFIQLWFRHNYDRLREQTDSRGGNQPNLNGLLLRQIHIPVPQLDIQRNISLNLLNQLESTQRAAELVQQENETIHAIPAALLRQAFVGAI